MQSGTCASSEVFSKKGTLKLLSAELPNRASRRRMESGRLRAMIDPKSPKTAYPPVMYRWIRVLLADGPQGDEQQLCLGRFEPQQRTVSGIRPRMLHITGLG